MPRMERRELNGLVHRLVIWDAPDEAPTLIALHGFLDLACSFAPFVESLRSQVAVRVIAPDLRGHGATEWIGRGGYYHFPDYVADMAALVESLGGKTPLLLLGHSMGGTIAALLAGTFPAWFERVVLIEGLGPVALPEDPPERMERWISEVRALREKAPRTMPDVQAAAARLRERNPRLTDSLARLLAQEGTRETDGGLVWSFDPLHRTRSPTGFVPAQFQSFLARISCPVLLVEGDESGWRQVIEAERASSLRFASREVISDSGHMVHQDQPEALAKVVARFLAERAPEVHSR